MKGTTPERLVRKQLWVYEHLFRTPSTSRPLRFQPNGNQRNRTLMLVTTLPFNNLAVVIYKFHPSDESNPYRVRLHTIRNDESPRPWNQDRQFHATDWLCKSRGRCCWLQRWALFTDRIFEIVSTQKDSYRTGRRKARNWDGMLVVQGTSKGSGNTTL